MDAVDIGGLRIAFQREGRGLGPLGVKSIRKFVDPENPNRAGLLLDVPDLDTIKRMTESPETAEAMEYRGVIPETVVILVERE